MDRHQKKCFIVSASMHGLLAGALLFGSAFLAPSSKSPDLDVLTIIPETLVDAPLFNPGGNPRVTQPPATAPLFKPEPLPPPAPKPEPVARTEPVAPRESPPKPTEVPDFTKPATAKKGPTVNPKPTVRQADPRARTASADSEAEERTRAKVAADVRRQKQRALDSAIKGVGGVASSSTSVEIPGPGGEAFASYQQVLKSIYTQAWIVPPDVTEGDATTRTSVTIARDGTVLSARIIGLSGNDAVDASVRRTLERITTVPPFPPGAKDKERTFTISFNVNAKRQLG